MNRPIKESNMSTQKNEKPWHKNAGNLLVVNSILAAISILDIGLLFQDSFVKHRINNHAFWVAVISGFISLFIFIATSEKIPEAVEQDNVDKYIVYMLPYNIGVLGLIISLVFGQISRSKEVVSLLTNPIVTWAVFYMLGFIISLFFDQISRLAKLMLTLILIILMITLKPIERSGFVISVFVWSFIWGKDSLWLLFSGQDEFDEYKSELEVKPLTKTKYESLSFTNIFFKIMRHGKKR